MPGIDFEYIGCGFGNAIDKPERLRSGVQNGRKEDRKNSIHHFRREIIEQTRQAENDDILGQPEHFLASLPEF
jgi:hypothetical protein